MSVLSLETKMHRKVYSQQKKEPRAKKCGRSEPKRVDVEHLTYLTVGWGRDIYNDKAKNHANESGHTRERVNLPNEQINSKTEHDR